MNGTSMDINEVDEKEKSLKSFLCEWGFRFCAFVIINFLCNDDRKLSIIVYF